MIFKKGANTMKKETEVLLMSYQNQFYNDIDSYKKRYGDQKIDYAIFNFLIESTYARYIGHLDTLYDVDRISYTDWKKYYDQANKYCDDCRRRIRKAELEPSDPVEEG